MGSTQSLPIDSYLDRHLCSGRNITWHYIHNNGSLPEPYSQCPYAYGILSSHCCADGACTPSWFDREYGRYPYANWDGLGDPYKDITNTVIGDWDNSTSNSTAASENKQFEQPARGGMCLGMEPSLWYAGYHWPPLGVDGRPLENFRQMKWRDSSNRDEKQQQATGSNASARSGRLEHRVVTSDAAPMKTITISKLASYILTDLKAALWKMGTPINTLGFFMGILVGYLICLETNGGLPQPIESQLSRLRALQTEETGPQTSTAKTNKKKKKSRNKTVASQQNGLQVPNDLIPPPTSLPTPAPQNNDPEVSDVPTNPQAPRNGASENNDLQVLELPVPPQALRSEPSQNDDLLVPDLSVPSQAPRDGASQSNDPQVSDIPLHPQTTRNVASQNNKPQVSDATIGPQAPKDGVIQKNDLQIINDSVSPTASRTEVSQYNDLQVPNISIRPQASRNGDNQNSNIRIPIDLTPPISPWTPAPRNYFAIDDNSTRNGASQSRNPQILNELAPLFSLPTPVPQNNYLAIGNSSTPPRYNVRERRRLYVDWGSLRRTDNAGSQSTIGTHSQQGSQSASQRVSQQGSRGASTDSGSQRVGAQHRDLSTRPRQRLS